MRVAAFCVLSFAAPTLLASQDVTVGSGVLEKFLASNQNSLVSYKALRRLSVVARGGKMEASLVALTTLDPERGFVYEVLEETGSGFLRSRVLHPVLEAERLAKLRDKGAHGALTEANYRFGDGELTPEGLMRVSIKPRRKDELLMDGSILLTCEDADLLTMEGLLVKRPSFWTRRVHIVRHYTRIGGARVPVSTGSTADVLFAGKSSFSMSYEYEMINGQAVTAADGAAPTLDPRTAAR
jgi:hypothetical protein